MSSAPQPLQRILLVDDSLADRRLVTREIDREFSDVEIREAADLQTFERLFPAEPFDLVITDYELHWATGIDILQWTKAHDPMMPVVMFTDSGSQEIAVEAMKKGLDDYVLKSPKHLIRLSQAVQTVWENSQLRRRANELDLRQRFLLNQLEVGVFRADLEGQLMEVNDGFLRLLGLSSLEQAKPFFRDNFGFTAVDRAPAGLNAWEKQLRRPDGQVIWVQVNESLMAQTGTTVIDGLVSNITEKKEATLALERFNIELETRVKERTAQLEASNRQLRDTNQELELLAYAMSHDLRAPIRQIEGFAYLLREEITPLDLSESVQTYLQRISGLTAQANHMIDDLFDYSKTGRADMRLASVNMAQIVQEIKQQVSREQPDRDIVWRIDEPLPPAEGDRAMLQRVWQNLIANAVKYTRYRDRAEIVIRGQEEGDRVIFSITDNGVGFDKKYADRVFSPFQRLHTDNEFEGTGIGLANVQRIVHRHNGQIWTEAVVDGGATFYFAVPKNQRQL